MRHKQLLIDEPPLCPLETQSLSGSKNARRLTDYHQRPPREEFKMYKARPITKKPLRIVIAALAQAVMDLQAALSQTN
jgi:hypothetical protein